MKIILLAIFLPLSFLACKTNSITGRNQLDLVPEAEVQAMALTQYKEFLSKNPVVPSGNANQEMVRRVGSRLATAVTKYYNEHGAGDELKGYKWEFNLVEAKDVNAWCMPGGKVVVYTGLLPVTQNEAGLAVVMGHEIAHAVAKHGNERMSQGLVQQMGGVALSVAVANQPAATQDLFLNAYGIGTTIGGTLPFSRKHELEADHYG